MTRPRGRQVVTGPMLLEVGLCGVATSASGLVYGRFFATTEYLPSVSAAALGAAVAATVARLCGWRWILTLLAAVMGIVLLACYGVYPGTLHHGIPALRTASELAHGVVGGWARMLTTALPADVRPDLLITPVLITWITGFAMTTLTLHTRSVLAPLAPGLAALSTALLLVGTQADIQATATTVFVAAALLLMLLRANRTGTGTSHGSPRVTTAVQSARRPRRAVASRLSVGMPMIAIVTLLGITGGHVLPLATGEHRFDLRALFPPPIWITDILTPLAMVKNQLREEPPRALFTLRVDDLTAPVERIKTAALDTFDGVLWTSSDRCLSVGRQLAAQPTSSQAQRVRAHIALDTYVGPFLPMLGRPVRLDLPKDVPGPVGFCERSGLLVTAQQALRGMTYDLMAEVSSPDAQLPLALPSATREFLPYTALPDNLPPQLRMLAQRLTAAQPTPHGKLIAIEHHLRGLPYTLDAPPGHSSATLTQLLAPTAPHDADGYAEQHAAAFAVLARAAGFPTRIVVGYRLHPSQSTARTVTTRDAHAWAEVHFDGYGWIPFEPTDPLKPSTPPRVDPQGPTQRPPQSAQPAVAPPRIEPAPDSRANPPSTPSIVALAAIVVGFLAVAAAALIVLGKARRRWRRRHASSGNARVLGAWLELTDRLTEWGVRASISLTPKEVAERATDMFGQVASLMELADLATAAMFSPHEPDHHTIDRAWRLEAGIRRRRYPRRLSPRRVRDRLDPRPLLAGWREARHHHAWSIRTRTR